MGKTSSFFGDDLQLDLSSGVDLKLKSCQTATLIRNKIYVIGGIDEPTSTIGVRIYDKSTGKWVIPVVLGTKPKPFSSHSAILLNEDRIMIVKGDCTSDDCAWFLEVDTEFVKEQKIKFATEVIAWSKGVIGDANKPIVVSGPSGVGKGTLITKLMKEFPTTFGFSVSHTTRAPRQKEVNAMHYHFSERNVMEEEIKAGKFLEFALVHGNLYGTSIEAVDVVADAGKRCILDIDVQGARSIRASSLEAIFIFTSPPSFEELEKRLRARGTETEEQIQKRLRNAKAELEQGMAPGLFDHILVNDDLEACYKRLKQLLGLDERIDSTPKSRTEVFHLPREISISKNNQKILIDCGVVELENTSKNMVVLDFSSMKGGAPGRTRGLNMYAIYTHANGVNGSHHLS